MFIYLHIFIIEAARGDFFYKVRSADKFNKGSRLIKGFRYLEYMYSFLIQTLK